MVVLSVILLVDAFDPAESNQSIIHVAPHMTHLNTDIFKIVKIISQFNLLYCRHQECLFKRNASNRYTIHSDFCLFQPLVAEWRCNECLDKFLDKVRQFAKHIYLFKEVIEVKLDRNNDLHAVGGFTLELMHETLWDGVSAEGVNLGLVEDGLVVCREKVLCSLVHKRSMRSFFCRI